MFVMNLTKKKLVYRGKGVVIELKPGVNLVKENVITAKDLVDVYGTNINVINREVEAPKAAPKVEEVPKPEVKDTYEEAPKAEEAAPEAPVEEETPKAEDKVDEAPAETKAEEKKAAPKKKDKKNK